MPFFRRHLVSLGLAVLVVIGLALLSNAPVEFCSSACNIAQCDEHNASHADRAPGTDCCDTHVFTALALITTDRQLVYRMATAPLRITDEVCPDGLSRKIDYPPQLS